MTPNNRTNQKQGCPICANKKAGKSIREANVRSKGSLSDTDSPVLQEWDYEKNRILPSEVTLSSKLKVWWKCKKCGASWQASIQNRTKKNGTKCPYCTGKKVSKGYNDFQTIHPDLAEEWSPKNKELTPDMFTCGSAKRIVWVCRACGNEWIASVNDRANGHGCPVCAQQIVANSRKKKVICVETGTVFESVNFAAEWANISPSTLVGCLKGHTKTAGGFHWKYDE